MSPTVRRIRPGEALRLRELRLAALAESPAAFSATFADTADQPIAFWVERVASTSSGALAATFVADVDGSWLGMVAGYRADPDRDTVELVSMWVAPEARGSGVGAALVDAVVDWARQIPVAGVELWVMRDNAPAVTLYERCGFVRLDDYRADPSDPCAGEIRMSWTP